MGKGIEADIPLMRLSIDPSQDLSGLLLESQLHVFFRPNTLLGFI
jgi:hypothetical protein